MGRKHPRIPPALKIGPSSIVFSIGCLLLVFGLAALFSPIRGTQQTFGKLIADKAELRASKGPTPGHSTDFSGFRLTNVGGRPVSILSVKASCGCAKAEASKETVEAGGHVSVYVDVEPLETGMRPVGIVVETDSPVTPVIDLQLYVLGWRKPPYLFQSDGDLHFSQLEDLNDVRDITVQTIQPARDRPRAPELSTDLPFLTFTGPSVTSDAFSGDSSLVVHSFRYRTKFKSEPRPAGGFDGRVSVSDPWDPLRVQSLLVRGEVAADIAASPSRLILKLSGSEDDGAVAKFLVKSRNPNTGLRVRPKDEDGSPLVIIPSSTSKDPGVRLYEIHIRPGARLEEKIYHVLIESTDGSVAGTSLPILVSREDES